jgi:hypothetical protein
MENSSSIIIIKIKLRIAEIELNNETFLKKEGLLKTISLRLITS